MIAALHDPPGATPPPPHPPFTIGLTPWAQTLPQHISPTAAKSYLSCSLRFWFERVACIRKPTTPTLHLGKAVHAALQAFHLARWRSGDDSPEASRLIPPRHAALMGCVAGYSFFLAQDISPGMAKDPSANFCLLMNRRGRFQHPFGCFENPGCGVASDARN